MAFIVLALLRVTLLGPSRSSVDTPPPAAVSGNPTPPPVRIRKVHAPPQSAPADPPSTLPVATRPAPRIQPAASAPAPVADTFDAQLAAGKQALRKGRPSESLRFMQRAVTLRPEETTGLQWLVTALEANDRHAETIPLLKTLLRRNPGDTTARYNLAMALGRQGDYLQAEDVYWELLEIAPDHVEARINLAMLYQHECRLGAARRQWENVIQRDPKSFVAYEGLGEVLTDLGKTDEAMDAFAHAATLQPKVASAWLNYAASATAAGAAGRAITALDRALKLAPYDAEAWSMRGDILLELYRTTRNEQHARRAVQAWKKSLTLLPEQPRLRARLKTYSRFDVKTEQIP